MTTLTDSPSDIIGRLEVATVDGDRDHLLLVQDYALEQRRASCGAARDFWTSVSLAASYSADAIGHRLGGRIAKAIECEESAGRRENEARDLLLKGF